MRFLHTMLRVHDLDTALHFFGLLGLEETRRHDSEGGRFSLVFLSAGDGQAELELTHNWDEASPYGGGRNFGHIAFEVDNVYEICRHLAAQGVTILRPPRDGRMAFVRSPDQISVELLQRGEALSPEEPWLSMASTGEW
jgi:lactoylglutathione lyase